MTSEPRSIRQQYTNSIPTVYQQYTDSIVVYGAPVLRGPAPPGGGRQTLPLNKQTEGSHVSLLLEFNYIIEGDNADSLVGINHKSWNNGE